MLFDLRGRRRRAVQVTYLMLALLLGGGLVLFGIGGEVSGGLVDAFKGGGGGNTDSALRDRAESQEERLAKSPQNEAVLQNLIRDYYSLATAQRESGTIGFPEESRDELRKAAGYWQRYVEAADGEPSAEAARYASLIYDAGALNRPKEALRAAQIVAREANDVASYLNLVSIAALAKDTRTADLAATKAVDLAPKDQRKAVKREAEARKQPPSQQQPSG
jgi:hypothetical protein